ncbi:MAG: hypothetical protein QXD46_01125 [Thermofilum sp.]
MTPFSPSFSSIAAAYLKTLSRIFDKLCETAAPPAHPSAVLAAGLVLSVEASFSRGFGVPVAAAALGGALAAASGKLRSWLSTTLLVAAFSAVVAAPAAVSGSCVPAALLVARAAGGAGAFTGAFAALGWFWALEGLRRLRLGNFVAWELWLTLRMIPLQARDIARMLAAREARLVAKGGVPARLVAASTVGDILVLSYRRARVLSMAIEARTLARSSAGTAASLGEKRGAAALAAYTLLCTLLFFAGA